VKPCGNIGAKNVFFVSLREARHLILLFTHSRADINRRAFQLHVY
jgi:hypothetical protein